MTSPVTTALPYGVRDCKLTEYIDASGEVLGPTSVDLPYMQTFNFSEAEEYQELRGDDKLITTRGRGSQVNWDLESGGIAPEAWAIATGGDIVETGLPPNRVVEIRKRATQSRPWFRVDGRIVSDSGGDVLVRVYRCRANDTIQANFTDGEFTTTAFSGVGYPLLSETMDLIYSIFRRETASELTLTPDPNPVQVPLNLTVGTLTGVSPTVSVQLLWTPVVGATLYTVQKSIDGGATWIAGVPPTSVTANVTETGLATGSVKFRIKATVGGIDSEYTNPVTVVIP